ncbi:GNAT family N-acetyltransferase [Mesobacillus subterraneus]|uniref:GNAT family N-acetyltransferase n=1 Tax=Mesobacillus subterraneus TaxID=285983 RepID=UPI001FEC0D49|nr:GNAT family N-acetyltransferase [Mesobacillus subterraneus]
MRTERLVLSRLTKSDFNDVKKLYMDQEVRKYLGGVIEERVLLAAGEALLLEEGSHFWIVKEKESEEFIGMVSITNHHDGEWKEISYQLLPEWWGLGYGTECVNAIIKYAFEELKLPRVIAETQTANTASCRLLEKVGMQREKTLIRFNAEQAIYYRPAGES